MASPSAGAPALKYGYVNTVTTSHGEIKLLIRNDKINSNNNILLEIMNDLQQLKNNSKDNLNIKTLGDIINKINYIIDENKKNLELI